MMSTLSELKRHWHELRTGAVGTRFANHHERIRRKSRPRTIAMFAAGALLILAGLANAFIPGPGGLLLASLGLVLMASSSRRVAQTLDRCEPVIRRWHARVSRTWPVRVVGMRVMFVVTALTVSTIAVVLAFGFS